MSTVTVETRAAERVAIVTMNHERENRFHPTLLAELGATLTALETDDAVGALVLTGGDPKFFSNGLDLTWILEHIGEPETIRDYLGSVNRLYRQVTLYPKPTIAALNGHCYAGGMFLAAHLDFRFMRADRGWICLPEVDINIPLLPGMIAICQAIMPPHAFRQLYYTGKRVTGPEALQLGIVDGVYAAEELLPQAVAFAAELARKRTATYAEMKRRIRADVARLLDEVDPGLFATTLALAMGG